MQDNKKFASPRRQAMVTDRYPCRSVYRTWLVDFCAEVMRINVLSLFCQSAVKIGGKWKVMEEFVGTLIQAERDTNGRLLLGDSPRNGHICRVLLNSVYFPIIATSRFPRTP